MQLVDTTAGNSCHGNPQMQCSFLLLCFLLTRHWVRGRWHTSARGWESAPRTVAGKVFNWGWNPWRVGQFLLWRLLWWECPFACCFGSIRKMKTFTTGYLYGKISPCTRWHVRMHTFFSFITLTQVKMVLWCYVAQWMERGRSNAAGAQCEIFSLLHRQKWRSCSFTFICQAGLMWPPRQHSFTLFRVTLGIGQARFKHKSDHTTVMHPDLTLKCELFPQNI